MKKRKYFNNKLPSDAEYFGTPDYAIDPIIKYIPKGVKHIWEPTAGQCNIVNRLKHHGYTLTATDKYPQMKSIVRHDFLLDPLLDKYDMIIMNPPFKQMIPFIEKMYEQDKPFMFIGPAHTINSIKRQVMFKKHGINVIAFDKRVEYVSPDAHHCPYYSHWFLGNVDEKNNLYFEVVKKLKH